MQSKAVEGFNTDEQAALQAAAQQQAQQAQQATQQAQAQQVLLPPQQQGESSALTHHPCCPWYVMGWFPKTQIKPSPRVKKHVQWRFSIDKAF